MEWVLVLGRPTGERNKVESVGRDGVCECELIR